MHLQLTKIFDNFAGVVELHIWPEHPWCSADFSSGMELNFRIA